MTNTVLADVRRRDDVAPPRPAPRRTWMVAVAVIVVCALALGYLVGNEVQVNTQFDQAHTSLDLSRHQAAVVQGDLGTVRRDLRILNGRVRTDTSTLQTDSTYLEGMEAALVQAQSTVSHQGATINDLQSCLGGVQQALNALAVGDQDMGLDALGAVSGPCQSVASASG